MTKQVTIRAANERSSLSQYLMWAQLANFSVGGKYTNLENKEALEEIEAVWLAERYNQIRPKIFK